MADKKYDLGFEVTYKLGAMPGYKGITIPKTMLVVENFSISSGLETRLKMGMRMQMLKTFGKSREEWSQEVFDLEGALYSSLHEVDDRPWKSIIDLKLIQKMPTN